MRQHSAILLGAFALLGMAASAVWAQGVPVRDSVTVIAPDGGLGVTIPAPVRVVGPTFGEVQVGGIVTLSNSTLGALGTESCTVGVARTLSVGTTAVAVPATPLAGRTRILIINASENQDIRCVADAAGANPTCAVPGVGLPIFQKGSSVTFTVRDTVAVKCIACNSSAPVAYQEEACVPP